MAIVTKQNVVDVAGQAIANFPVLKLMNTELDSSFGSGSGITVKARVNGYGTVVHGDVALKDTDIMQAEVDVTLERVSTGKDVSDVDNAVNLNNFKEQIANPCGAALGDDATQIAFNEILAGATSNVIIGVDATTYLSKMNYANLASIIARMKASRMQGALGGILSSNMQAAITGSGANFPSSAKFGDAAWENVIGSFGNTDFVEYNNPVFTTKNVEFGTITIADAENGKWSKATVTANAFENITVGTVFAIASTRSASPYVYSDFATTVNVFGAPTSNKFSVKFLGMLSTTGKLLKNGETGYSTSTTACFTPIHYKGATGVNPLVNISMTAAASVYLAPLMEANTTYEVGSVFCKNDITWAAKRTIPLMSSDKASVSVNIPGIPVTMKIQNKDNMKEEVRWDFLCGAKSIRGISTVGIYTKVVI